MVGGRLILPLVTHRIRIDKDYVIRFNAIFNFAISDSIVFLSSTTSGRLDGVNFSQRQARSERARIVLYLSFHYEATPQKLPKIKRLLS